MNQALEDWTQGDLGDHYTRRNQITPQNIDARARLFTQIFSGIPSETLTSILEVGANIGGNIAALRQIAPEIPAAKLFATEPNSIARYYLIDAKMADQVSADHAGDLVGSSRVDLQACKLEYSIVSPK